MANIDTRTPTVASMLLPAAENLQDKLLKENHEEYSHAVFPILTFKVELIGANPEPKIPWIKDPVAE